MRISCDEKKQEATAAVEAMVSLVKNGAAHVSAAIVGLLLGLYGISH